MAMNNSLAEVHPELISEWSEKNLPLIPDEITFGSNKNVWWKGACGHEWQTSVKARSNGEKCPICSGARVIAGINDLATIERSEILPSEKAFAYKMRLEAMKRQGFRSDLTSDPVGQKFSVEKIADNSNDSKTQIQRYIRLTNLVPELLEFVNDGRIKMRPAVELSYLDEDCQRDVVDEIDLNDATPSHDQTIRMRKLFNEGNLTTEAIHAVMSEEKPNQREKIVLRGDRVRQLIPKNIPVSQTEDFVCKALEHYNKFLRNRAERDSR